MKRQAIGIRRSIDESEQNQVNESKKIKLFPKNCNEDSSTDIEVDTDHNAVSDSYKTQVFLNNSVVHEICYGNQPQENGTLNSSHDSHNNSHDSHSSSHLIDSAAFSCEHDSLNNVENRDLLNENHRTIQLDEAVNIPPQSDDTPSESPTVTKIETHSLSMKPTHVREEESALGFIKVVRVFHEVESEVTDTHEISCFELNKLNEVETSLLQPENDCKSSSSNLDCKSSSSNPHHNASQAPDFKIKNLKEPAKIIDLDKITSSHLQVTKLEGHADVIFCVAADEDIILSSSGDTTIKVWDVDKKVEISSFAGHNDAVTSVHLLSQNQSEILNQKLQLPKSSRVAVSASLDCHIRLWSVLEGQELLSLYTFNGITCLDYIESECYVVIGTEGGKLELWDLCSGKVIHSVFAHEDSVSDLKVEEYYVYSVSVDGTVKVWLFEENELQPIYTRRRKEVSVNKAEFGAAQWKAIAAHSNKLYLGDNSSNLKVLDWRAGRLKQFKNQMNRMGICEALFAKNNILLSTFYDSSSDSGGINVWQLPDISYVCTLTGDIQDICSVAVTQIGHNLRIVSGGHQLLIWDFDFTQPPKKSTEETYYISENDKIGIEMDEKVMSNRSIGARNDQTSLPDDNENNSNKSWCNVM